MKGVLFVGIFLVLFYALNVLLQPDLTVWTGTNTYANLARSFYRQPENTIEVLCIGTSTTMNGVVPMELYEDYGICAYNMSTEQQSAETSYFMLQEVYRLHGETLKTVLIETAFQAGTNETIYHKTLDMLQLSPVKWNAVWEHTDGNLSEMLPYLLPALAYHDRWAELTESDFTKYKSEAKDYLRGYNFVTDMTLDSSEYTDIAIMNPAIDADAGETQLSEEALSYMQKIVAFCTSHDLKLVMVRMPRFTEDSLHNALQALADCYSIEFLDFSFDPLLTEIGYVHATDALDYSHLNYYGAKKVTAWLGQYLADQCGATDVRGQEAYQFMEEQLSDYHKKVSDVVALLDVTDPAEYLVIAASNENHQVFLAVSDEASKELTDEQRERFASLGLQSLSDLSYRASYVGVIAGGKVLYEAMAADSEQTGEEAKSLTCQGVLTDGTDYKLISGGFNDGATASVRIGGTEYSDGSRGIHAVVYDRSSGKVVSTAVFDTYASAERECYNPDPALMAALAETDDIGSLSPRLLKLYKYDLRCENAQHAESLENASEENALTVCLETALQCERYAVFLSVADEVSEALGSEAREKLGALGFDGLAQLDGQESYAAVAFGGEIVHEANDLLGDSVTIVDFWLADGAETLVYSVASAGLPNEGTSSIRINGEEYSAQTAGIHLVVWDTVLGTAVHTAVFGSGGVSVQ